MEPTTIVGALLGSYVNKVRSRNQVRLRNGGALQCVRCEGLVLGPLAGLRIYISHGLCSFYFICGHFYEAAEKLPPMYIGISAYAWCGIGCGIGCGAGCGAGCG